MRNNTSNIVHSVIILLLQFLVLKNFSYIFFDRYLLSVFFYPLIIMFLSLNTPNVVVLITAFAVGLLADFFYAQPGVHSFALVFMAFSRNLVLKIVEPRHGYRIEALPTSNNYGLTWFMSYSAILLVIFMLIFQIADVFTLIYIDKILVNTVVSFIISYFLIILYQLIIKK